VLVVVV
jgi:hypothetical protein